MLSSDIESNLGPVTVIEYIVAIVQRIELGQSNSLAEIKPLKDCQRIRDNAIEELETRLAALEKYTSEPQNAEHRIRRYFQRRFQPFKHRLQMQGIDYVEIIYSSWELRTPMTKLGCNQKQGYLFVPRILTLTFSRIT